MAPKEPLLTENITAPVGGMSCSACAQTVEQSLRATQGVTAASVNFALHKAFITYDAVQTTPAEIQAAVAASGYSIELPKQTNTTNPTVVKNKSLFPLLVTVSAAAIVVVVSMIWHHPPQWVSVCIGLLATAVVLVSGRRYHMMAFKRLKHGGANMDTLVSLSSLSAVLFSWWSLLAGAHTPPILFFEAGAAIVAFMRIGSYIESRSRHSSSAAIEELLKLKPTTVRLVVDENYSETEISSLRPGDVVAVFAGELIPADGKITRGNTTLDMSFLTGETLPVDVTVGDSVVSGAMNQTGTVWVRSSTSGTAGTLNTLINRVEQALAFKSPIQRITDKISAVFVPIVILICIGSFIAFSAAGEGTKNAITVALSVLAVACPCAMGLAVPTALAVALGRSARLGFIARDIVSFEQLGNATDIVFDKTGTLTHGNMNVQNVQIAPSENDEKILQLFASLEVNSAHPLAQAIVRYSSPFVPTQLQEIHETPGQGISAKVNDSTLHAGSLEWLQSLGCRMNDWNKESRRSSESRIGFAMNNKVVAVAFVSDTVREEATATVRQLVKQGLQPHILSGDNAAAVEVAANLTGISHYSGGATPEAKATYIRRLQSNGAVVVMIGDGINDAEALAVADVSVAMGNAVDVAGSVAHIQLMRRGLSAMNDAVALARKTRSIIRQNLFWAFGYNVLLIPIAAGVLYPLTGILLDPMLAGLAMALSSITVVLNSLRLRSTRLSINN